MTRRRRGEHGFRRAGLGGVGDDDEAEGERAGDGRSHVPLSLGTRESILKIT